MMSSLSKVVAVGKSVKDLYKMFFWQRTNKTLIVHLIHSMQVKG